jgi:transcriptional regulator with XRE-family HTH domain
LRASSFLFYLLGMANGTPKLTRQNGEAIRHFRIARGWKVNDLALKADSSYPHLDNVENERKEASVELIYRLANVLDVPARALVRDPRSLVRESDVA